MRFRNLDENGDWTFGKGRNSYLSDDKALMMNIRTRLLEFLGDCFWDTEKGIDWWNLLGGKNYKTLLASVQRVVLRSSNVKKIVKIGYTVSDRNFAIQLAVQFLDGTILTDTVEVFNA